LPIQLCKRNFIFQVISKYRRNLQWRNSWYCETHLIIYTSLVIELMFPTGLANMLTGQPIWFSYSLDLCNKAYQGRGPENCENTKFVTHFCWVERLINLVFLVPYIILVVVVGQRPTSTRPATIYGIMQNQWFLEQFRLLIMCVVSPETCWASFKYGLIQFWYTVASCWSFLYEL
jgi:hypothetical protein